MVEFVIGWLLLTNIPLLFSLFTDYYSIFESIYCRINFKYFGLCQLGSINL